MELPPCSFYPSYNRNFRAKAPVLTVAQAKLGHLSVSHLETKVIIKAKNRKLINVATSGGMHRVVQELMSVFRYSRKLWI